MKKNIILITMLLPILAVSQSHGQTDISELNSDIYHIRNGDVLEIFTWKEPDFTKEVLVRTDGMISFPLLDDVQAAGLTPMELKHTLQERLKKFIVEPAVTVSVKVSKPPVCYVMGEIAKIGAYPLDKPITVLQLFALAGGFSQWASTTEIILIRRDKIIPINYKAIASGKDLTQNLLMEPDDIIIVP